MDEINWSVPYDNLREVIAIMTKLMTVKIPGWPIPLINGLEVGLNWGATFAFNFDPETMTFTPDYEIVKEEVQEDSSEQKEPEIDFSDIFWEEDAPLDEE